MPSADSSLLGSSSKLGGSDPSAPKSGLSIKGSSPSKPNKLVDASPLVPKRPTLSKAPKRPTLPKLPKPKSGWKPPKGTLPGYTPGHPPYHGSGGHLPVIQTRDNGQASSVSSCINPKGFERLSCEEPDAIMATLFSVIGLLLAPFLIYMCVQCFKRRMNKRKARDEEDGVELRGRARYRDPSPVPEGEVSDWSSNIGLAISTSEETVTLAKEEQTQHRSSGSGSVRTPSLVYQPRAGSSSRGRRSAQVDQPRTRNPGRGRERSRDEESLASSLSSGMIRTAMLGQALQDAMVVNVPPSLASSRKNSARMSSSRDVDRSSDGNSRGDGGRDTAEDQWCECMENNVVDGEEAKSGSSSSGRRSSSRGQ